MVTHFLWISQALAVYAPTPVSTYNYPSTTPAVASHYQSIVRSLDGNPIISSYGKAIETPHSNVRKYDSRITNDALLYSHVPTVSAYPAALYHKPATYVSPVYHYPSPAYYPHASYSPSYTQTPVYHASVYPTTSYHSPAQYFNPYVKSVPVHPHTVPYSDATAVSHISFEGLGTNYAW